MTLVPNLRCHKLCVCKFWWLKYGYFPHKSMGEISVLLPVAFPDEDYCSSLHQSTGGDVCCLLAQLVVVQWCKMVIQMWVNFGPGNGLLPSSIKSSPGPLLTHHVIYFFTMVGRFSTHPIIFSTLRLDIRSIRWELLESRKRGIIHKQLLHIPISTR